MNELDLNSFSEVKISDREILDKVLRSSNKLLCNYNFSNLYIWGEIYKTRWKLYKDGLLLYDGFDDFISMPVGRYFELGEIVEISDNFIKQSRSGNFDFVDADYIEKNKNITDYFKIEIDENNADYIYLTRKLYELKGKKLHKKKNLISQFLQNNPDYISRKLEKQFFKDCFELAERWCRKRNCDKIGYTHETSALGRAFEKFEELKLEGLGIFVKDKMVAFSLFDRQNENMADVHFEKYDPEIKGSEQIICWEVAKYLLDKYEYINREEDMGIEGLRQSKKSYDPVFIIKTYKLYRK